MATTTKRDAATHEQYLQLHRWMCMAKALDDRMHILVKQGRAPFVGSSRGHEGIQVASTAAIGPDDWLVPHYRGLAEQLSVLSAEEFDQLWAYVRSQADD